VPPPTANGVATPSLTDVIGKAVAPTNDPAWQAPTDPLKGVDIQAKAGAVTREIPLVCVGTSWDVGATRGALGDLVIGLFDRPSQLIDSIVGDSRVQAAMASRTGGILGRPVDFITPRKLRDSDLARECRDAFVDAWPTMAAESILGELQTWAVMGGFGPAQILWDTGGDYAIPHMRPWHPRYTYYHWIYRCYVAVTMDGQTPIIPGDGHWINHCPHGEYRGWMRGAVRAIAPWWLARNYALRDWARYSERHGLPMIKAKTPALGDPVIINSWRQALSSLGQETVLHLPQSVAPGMSYDIELLEAADTAHEGFGGLIGRCDMEITLALLAQNLTTEIKEGSMAAARVHADVRQSLLEADARALAQTIYQQLARPFAAMNFGDPDLAPMVVWNVKPYEDDLTAVQTFAAFASALKSLRDAGFEVGDASRLAKDFGLDLGALKAVAPPAPAPGGFGGGAPGARARAGASSLRVDPRLAGRVAASRVRVAGDGSAELHEAIALAEQEAEQAKRKPRRRRP
jgi:hypothetical protein